MAIIPGISIGQSRLDAHAFIQFIDAVAGKTEYFRFAYGDFHCDDKKFDVRIGPNRFSDKELVLALENENSRIQGALCFDHIVKYPKSILSPGIMGPFSFIPGMECYHGVVNISHTIRGCLDINGIPTDMTGGEGYIEKDWGHSFPSAWIWLQANHFEETETSFMFSLARIPWLGRSFTGLISFLKINEGFFKFATYNGSRVEHIRFDGDMLEARLAGRNHVLDFSARYSKGGILKAPKNGLMRREIEESITSEVALSLTDCRGKTVFAGNSKWGGMEIAGELRDIL